jgi:hypothetical protein
MSSASIPPPRVISSSASSRHSFFWPILIYLVGAGALSFYHVMSLETQYEEVARAIDKLDPQVKHAEYNKNKFFAFARDLVRMAPTNASAAQIVKDTGLRGLQEKFPMLMSLDLPSGFTNAAPPNPKAMPAVEVYGGTNSTTNAAPPVPVVPDSN